MESLTLNPIGKIDGEINLPGSKSLSNRALLLAALAEGETKITNLLDSLFQTKKLKTTKGLWSEAEINRMLTKWSQLTEGKFKPFNGIAIYYLRKKIRSIQAQK